MILIVIQRDVYDAFLLLDNHSLRNMVYVLYVATIYVHAKNSMHSRSLRCNFTKTQKSVYEKLKDKRLN